MSNRAMMRTTLTVAIMMALPFLWQCAEPTQQAVSKKPNILLIVADDLGYSDIGAFGGEIDTPNLDRLASEGAQLTNFYASPFCSPTRSMLLSGADNHRAGMGDMAELMVDEEKGQPGYEGYLNFQVAAVPEVLREAGYRTVMAGKWHLGTAAENDPAFRGFDKSFAMAMGGASHWANQFGIATADASKPPMAIYRENGISIQLQEPFYSSHAFTSKLIQYLEETGSEGNKPFFAYLAFTAPHWPLHAPEADVEKYSDKYREGYEALRQNRLLTMKNLGLIQGDVQAYPGHELWKRWSELTQEERKSESRRMAVYAAMVDILDREIGRVLKYLKDTGQLDNTIVVFMSDNGADGNSIYDAGQTRQWIYSSMDNSTENIGNRDSYTGYGPGWAQVGMTPFRLYKAFMYEGGIRVPAIIWGPGQGVKGARKMGLAHVMDIAPTLYELAGTSHPGAQFEGRSVVPLQGQSLVRWLKGNEQAMAGSQTRAIGWELGGRKGLRKGDWKLVYANQPWGSGAWELYNVATDPTESRDMARERPDVMTTMLAAWKDYVAENGVLEIDGLAERSGYSNTASYYEDLSYEAGLKKKQASD